MIGQDVGRTPFRVGLIQDRLHRIFVQLLSRTVQRPQYTDSESRLYSRHGPSDQ